MKKVYVFLAEGFEDVEALIPIDVLRRGGVKVQTVAAADSPIVTSSHGVKMQADLLFEPTDFSDADLLFLPGGMPGAANLFAHEGVKEVVLKHYKAGGRVAAICAAPAVVLGQLGVLEGHEATCYPGFENLLPEGAYTGQLVTVSRNVTTAEGPAAAFPLAFELLSQLVGADTADKVAEGMRYKHLMGL